MSRAWMPFEQKYPTRAYGYDGKIHLERVNPRASRLKQARHLGTHTKEQWVKLRDQAGCCANCGRDDRLLTKDHIIPISRGGCDCIHNIQPLCRSCNSSKRDKDA